MVSKTICWLPSSLVEVLKGQYEYASARAHAMMCLNWKSSCERARGMNVSDVEPSTSSGTFHGVVIGELFPITLSSKSFFSLHCYHVATLNCQ